MPTIVEEYYVEMAWDCATCKTQNPGGSKICSNCGKPLAREDFHDKEDRPTTIADRVVDEKLLTKAKAGPDWECKYCGSHQQRGNGECATCGAGEKLSDGRAQLSDEKELPYEEVHDARPEIPPVAPSEEIVKQRYAEKAEKERRHRRALRRKTVLSFGGGLIGLSALIALVVWIFTPKYLDARISDVYFQHVAHVERRVTEVEHGFSPDSNAFDVHQEGEKVHHTKPVQHGWDYPLVPEKVDDPPHCYTTPIKTEDGNCEPKKNGFKKCKKITTGGDKVCEPRSHYEKKPKKTPHYDDEPVYQPWYSWKVHKWVWNRSIPVNGHTNEVSWPKDSDIALNQNNNPDEPERLKMDATYSITFSDRHDTWKYTPSGLPEYQRLKLGSVHHLKIVAGMVTILQ